MLCFTLNVPLLSASTTCPTGPGLSSYQRRTCWSEERLGGTREREGGEKERGTERRKRDKKRDRGKEGEREKEGEGERVVVE